MTPKKGFKNVSCNYIKVFSVTSSARLLKRLSSSPSTFGKLVVCSPEKLRLSWKDFSFRRTTNSDLSASLSGMFLAACKAPG